MVSPEPIVFGAVFETGFAQLVDDFLFADLQVVAECVEGWIAVAQFGVDEAVEHHWVFGKFHCFCR